jgi:hypothetical protein
MNNSDKLTSLDKANRNSAAQLKLEATLMTVLWLMGL